MRWASSLTGRSARRAEDPEQEQEEVDEVQIQRQGAELAREHGLDARPEAAEASGPPWRGLLAAAGSVSASAVIAGSRGRGAVASSVLGSVSAGLVHNADLPVLVVPSDRD